MLDVAENLLNLPDGRILAYSDIGEPSSSCLVIFFHGVFNVGSATRLGRELSDRHVHYVAPTLSGWGRSSPRDKSVPYNVALAADITALIEHLHPGDPALKIYLTSGSYGTVPAQILYGAPFDIFPFGSRVMGCMVSGLISPLRLHKGHAKSMTMSTYFAIGPPTQYAVVRLLRHLTPWFLGKITGTLDGAEKFIRAHLFDNMKEDERVAYAKWRADNHVEEHQLEHEFADIMVRSVATTWEGFYEMPDVINGEWGFRPDSLDEKHYKNRPIFLVASDSDTLTPDAMAKWLSNTYKNSHYKLITGGHLASLFQSDDLWKEFFAICNT